MKADNENSIEALARQALDNSLDSTPDHVSRRLAEARAAALQARSEATTKQPYYQWGLAASVALAGLMWVFQFANGPADGTVPQVTLAPHALAPHALAPQAATIAIEQTAAVDQSDALLVVLDIVELDAEAQAVVEDLEFVYWLSLQNGSDV